MLRVDQDFVEYPLYSAPWGLLDKATRNSRLSLVTTSSARAAGDPIPEKFPADTQCVLWEFHLTLHHYSSFRPHRATPSSFKKEQMTGRREMGENHSVFVLSKG